MRSFVVAAVVAVANEERVARIVVLRNEILKSNLLKTGKTTKKEKRMW